MKVQESLISPIKIKLPLPFRSDILVAAIALFASRLFIGFVSIMIKICEQEIDPNTTIFYRLWIATLFLGLWNGLLTIRSRLSNNHLEKQELYTPKIWGLLLLTGILISVFQIIWAWSVTQTSIANASLIHGLTLPFTILIGWLFFGHHFDKRFLVATVVALAGIMIISIDDLQFSVEKLQGDIVALVSALFTALYLLSVERLRKELSATSILMWSCAIGTVLTLPVILMIKKEFFLSSSNVWLAAIGLGLTLALGQGLVAYSLKMFSSGFVSIVCLFDPILSATYAWLIFSETLNLYNLLGFVTVLFSMYLTAQSKSVIQE